MEHFVRKTDEEISDITAEYEQAEVSRLTHMQHADVVVVMTLYAMCHMHMHNTYAYT